ncbi:hypothetical protein HYH03_013468 [Edaphochlamys debaryana]|uniref:Uncharacterized protein n=1 Tax=Edaphochlamys debaryana TaxID=47281 RepID=A0A836BSV7_9CHLO|nr:hypothetical protein HYH03_013468 [Edaphochlamys debaryana]|eukprot:KAG2487886.1 hypothetical protein HYH03_013468 [Edaphochlamys debaryana]
MTDTLEQAAARVSRNFAALSARRDDKERTLELVQAFGVRFFEVRKLSCIPKHGAGGSAGPGRDLPLRFLRDLLEAVNDILVEAALDEETLASVQPLMGPLLLELDGKGPHVEGVPAKVREGVAEAMEYCGRETRKLLERAEPLLEVVQLAALLAGLCKGGGSEGQQGPPAGVDGRQRGRGAGKGRRAQRGLGAPLPSETSTAAAHAGAAAGAMAKS